MAKCPKCERETRVTIFRHNHGHICPTCDHYINPPVLWLLKNWKSDLLVDPVSMTELPHTQQAFENCGFRLFRHKVFLKEEESNGTKEILIFRYFGNMACRLVTNYRWQRDLRLCPYIHCMTKEALTARKGAGK